MPEIWQKSYKQMDCSKDAAVCNTTILQEGFYIRLMDGSKISSNEIFAMCRYFNNIIFDDLLLKKVIDPHGRFSVAPGEVAKHIAEVYMCPGMDVYQIFLRKFLGLEIDDNDVWTLTNIPDWAKIYPPAMLMMAVNQFAETITKLPMYPVDIPATVKIPIRIFTVETTSLSMMTYTDGTIPNPHMVLEVTSVNLLGNKVQMRIAANTIKADAFINEKIAAGDDLLDLVLIISQYEKGAADHKLLCSYHMV